MEIELTDEKKRTVLISLQRLYREQFDEDLSLFQAEIILDFFVSTLGPTVYNQGVADTRKFMLDKLEDLDAEFYMPEAEA